MDDLISRQAAIDACDQSINLFEAVDRIKELPSVNPQKPICPSAGVDCEDCPAYEKKSEWQHDHEILRAYSDGASAVLDKIRADIKQAYDDDYVHETDRDIMRQMLDVEPIFEEVTE